MELIKQLINDHEVIMDYVDLFEKNHANNSCTQQINQKMIDFVQNFADRYHHEREENILFVELQKEGILTHCNPIQQMLFEHNTGRDFILKSIEALEKDNLEESTNALLQFCDLIRMHIHKENNILFPMAQDALQEENNQIIIEKMKAFQVSGIYEEGQKYYKEASLSS